MRAGRKSIEDIKRGLRDQKGQKLKEKKMGIRALKVLKEVLTRLLSNTSASRLFPAIEMSVFYNEKTKKGQN